MYWEGVVVAVYLAPAAGAPMVGVEAVEAVPGRGLVGDRYYAEVGTYSRLPGSGRALTLIEDETLEALYAERGLELPPGASRRNIVTRDVPLNHLVEREFWVGPVRLRGTRLCEPCLHLERLAGQRGVRAALVHRGGLRADILTAGVVRVGEVVRPA